MKTDAELEREIAKGENAKRILEDPMVRGALDGMRDTVYHNIRTSHHSKVDEREDLYKMLRAIDAFEKEFTTYINGGKKAKSLLEKLFKGN